MQLNPSDIADELTWRNKAHLRKQRSDRFPFLLLGAATMMSLWAVFLWISR